MEQLFNRFYQGINVLGQFKTLINTDCAILIITDDNIPVEIYQKLGLINYQVITIKNGEESKSMDNYQLIITHLLNNHFSKNDLIIGVGGGVISDLCGFVSATYKRGIRLALIPTTIIAIVDSCIGGKNGINFPNQYGLIKNCLGTIRLSELVLVSIEVLDSLPKREILNGLCECLKAAIINDYDLYKLIIKTDLNNLSQEVLYEILKRSIKVKKDIIEVDLYENSIRKHLNLGHTIGHGIELTTSLLHGEAVAYGMLPFVSTEIKNDLKTFIKKYLPRIDTFNNEMIFEKILNDKKIINNGINCVTAFNGIEIKKYQHQKIKELINEINIWN